MGHGLPGVNGLTAMQQFVQTPMQTVTASENVPHLHPKMEEQIVQEMLLKRSQQEVSTCKL